MADYFDEMHCTPLADGQAPDGYLHFARLLRDFGMFEELGETQRLPPPVSKKFLEELSYVENNERDAKCTVCLKEFSIKEQVRQLPCSHSFHDDCIMPWLNKTSTCPLCRHDLPTDDDQYEEYKKSKKREKAREEELDLLHNSMFS